ncbi:MAG TPA: hypothetical protein VG847_09120 [Chitinophagaceae bacterium]|nr:hypothetical protein [Chitinophagaceae bacterium]
MRKKIRLIFTFYRSFFPASFAITTACLWIFFHNGMASFMIVFWFKIITLGGIYYFSKQYKAKEFYYYRNVGISSGLLRAGTLCCETRDLSNLFF